MDNLGFVTVGYVLTAAVLAGYAVLLLRRDRRARSRAKAILEEREGIER